MLTPFKENGEVDWAGVDALTDWYIEAGVAGLFAVCLSSEMYELTEEEKINLVRRVVKRSAGKVPVVASGTFGGSIKRQAQFIKNIPPQRFAAPPFIKQMFINSYTSGNYGSKELRQLSSLSVS
ncbi:MAG: dihydrodipicolinate synthase family protein [Deltaproteobacteria bacterium]|nr:dihydrodipicolinate synthase family protein [Deltaproteobacteria bacterium]